MTVNNAWPRQSLSFKTSERPVHKAVYPGMKWCYIQKISILRKIVLVLPSRKVNVCFLQGTYSATQTWRVTVTAIRRVCSIPIRRRYQLLTSHPTSGFLSSSRGATLRAWNICSKPTFNNIYICSDMVYTIWQLELVNLYHLSGSMCYIWWTLMNFVGRPIFPSCVKTL